MIRKRGPSAIRGNGDAVRHTVGGRHVGERLQRGGVTAADPRFPADDEQPAVAEPVAEDERPVRRGGRVQGARGIGRDVDAQDARVLRSGVDEDRLGVARERDACPDESALRGKMDAR